MGPWPEGVSHGLIREALSIPESAYVEACRGELAQCHGRLRDVRRTRPCAHCHVGNQAPMGWHSENTRVVTLEQLRRESGKASAANASEAVKAHGGLRPAARALGVPKSTLESRVAGCIPRRGLHQVVSRCPRTGYRDQNDPVSQVSDTPASRDLGQVSDTPASRDLGQVSDTLGVPPASRDLGQVAATPASAADFEARAQELQELRDWAVQAMAGHREEMARRRETGKARPPQASFPPSYDPAVDPFEPTRPKANGAPAKGSNGCQS